MSTWRLYDPKYKTRVMRRIERLKLHESILYEFSLEKPLVGAGPETDAGKQMKMIGLLNSGDTDIQNAYDSCMDKLSFTLTKDQKIGYEDVFSIDDGMFEGVENPDKKWADEVFVFEIYYNNLYRGHVVRAVF